MRRIVASFLLCASAALSAMAPGAARAETDLVADKFAMAQKAATICADTVPDIGATASKLKAEGARIVESDPTMNFYAYSGYRVVIGLSKLHNVRNAVCVVIVEQMTPEQAQGVLQPLLAQSRARRIDDADQMQRWVGRLGAKPIIFGLRSQFDLHVIRGAGILFAAPQ